jgi:hypothetical protein
MNWRWPAKPGNDLVPWYVFLRRVVFWLPFELFRCLAWFFLWLGWGWRDAKFWWEESV